MAQELAAAVQALADPRPPGHRDELGNGDRPVAEPTGMPPIASRRSRATRGCSGRPGWPGSQPVGARHLYRLRSDGADAVTATCSGCGSTPPSRHRPAPLTRAGYGFDRAAAARVRHAVPTDRAFDM